MTKSPALSANDAVEDMWSWLRRAAAESQAREPGYAERVNAAITARESFSDALVHLLAEEMASPAVGAAELHAIIAESHKADPRIVEAGLEDLRAFMERDPAANDPVPCFLFYKGFHAVQIYRIAHWLWQKDLKMLALHLQGRMTRCYTVDIHPGATIGKGVMIDHAHNIVIGETAVVEDNVSMLHSVTLGAVSKERGDRHPKIRTGVLLGTGAKILGNIEIGEGSRVAAGSLVLKSVPPGVTVAGVPARIVGKAGSASPAQDMDQSFVFGDEGSSI